MPEGTPVPIGELGLVQNIQEMTEETVELSPTADSSSQVYDLWSAGDAMPNKLFRIRKDRKPGKVKRRVLKRLVDLGEQAAYVDQFVEQIGDPMKKAKAEIRGEFANLVRESGIDGVQSDEGNYNATYVPVPSVTPKDARLIYKTTPPELRRGVIARHSTIMLKFNGDFLKTRKGIARFDDVLRRTRRLLMDEFGSSRTQAYERVREGEVYEILDFDKIKGYVGEGIDVRGLTKKDQSRLEVDPVRDHEGVHVTRPLEIDERLARIRKSKSKDQLQEEN